MQPSWIQENTQKHTIHIRWEHNAKRVLDLVHENKICLSLFACNDPSPDAITKITKNYIPSLHTQLFIEGSKDYIQQTRQLVSKLLSEDEELYPHAHQVI